MLQWGALYKFMGGGIKFFRDMAEIYLLQNKQTIHILIMLYIFDQER